VLRPHTFLVRDNWLYGPLAGLLASPWFDKTDQYRQRFRYCGQRQIDGHRCVVLRGDVTTREGEPPSSSQVIWLAMDRSYIPIRIEHYGGNFGFHSAPTGIGHCKDFREVAPGTWYPFKTIHFAFNKQEMTQRRLVINWRRQYDVESVKLDPPVDDELFRNVVAPAGTEVHVHDEDRRYVGKFQQEVEGVVELDPARYLAMLAEAKVRDEEKKAREEETEDLIGKPAAESPKGMP
jgi:hypothetical protein